MFDVHWWIDRDAAPPPLPQQILEPQSIAVRRRARATDKEAKRRQATQATRTQRATQASSSHQRGAGPEGNRRRASKFELSKQGKLGQGTALPRSTAPAALTPVAQAAGRGARQSYLQQAMHLGKQQQQQQGLVKRKADDFEEGIEDADWPQASIDKGFECS